MASSQKILCWYMTSWTNLWGKSPSSMEEVPGHFIFFRFKHLNFI